MQRAVVQLAKSGTQLEGGDLRGLGETLSGGWVDDFKRASTALNSKSKSLDQVLSGIQALKSKAGEGDVKGTKLQYLAVVGAVQAWASDAGIASQIKGL